MEFSLTVGSCDTRNRITRKRNHISYQNIYTFSGRALVMSQNYKIFYEDYKNKLFSYLLKKSGNYDVSCDIMQESFARHFQHYGHDAVISPALLFTIARNALTDHFRYRDRFLESNDIIAQSEGDQERSLITKEETQKIHAAMDKIPEIDQEILSLAVAGVAYKDIASTMQLTEANVKVRVHRARSKLRQLMNNEVK